MYDFGTTLVVMEWMVFSFISMGACRPTPKDPNSRFWIVRRWAFSLPFPKALKNIGRHAETAHNTTLAQINYSEPKSCISTT